MSFGSKLTGNKWSTTERVLWGAFFFLLWSKPRKSDKSQVGP